MLLFNFVLCALLNLAIAQLRDSQVQQRDPCQEKVRKHFARVVSDVTYCDRYWECVDNQPTLYDCPNGLVFSGAGKGLVEGCDYPWRKQNACHGKQLANPPISTEHCDWLYGIFGHETSCTRYWTCWNGTATEQFCIGGLLYNEESHACDWPQHVSGCQKHPLCSEDPNANVRLGNSCERYWSCQGGYPRLQRCPATLVFDQHARRCVSPPTEDCDVPPPPPPEEEENVQGVIRGEGGLPPRSQILEGGPNNRPRARPRRPPPPPSFNIPEGATLIENVPQQEFVDQPSSQFREPPIEGAIPFN